MDKETKIKRPLYKIRGHEKKKKRLGKIFQREEKEDEKFVRHFSTLPLLLKTKEVEDCWQRKKKAKSIDGNPLNIRNFAASLSGGGDLYAPYP